LLASSDRASHARDHRSEPGERMTSELLRATLVLLDMTASKEWPRIAKEIDVTPAWLRALCNGQIKEPGVNKIERLYCVLSGKTVEL
jgi:hypothetical protein